MWLSLVERSTPWHYLHTEQGLQWGVVKHMVNWTIHVLIFIGENKFVCLSPSAFEENILRIAYCRIN